MFRKETRDGNVYEFVNVPDNAAHLDDWREHFGDQWVADACASKVGQAMNNEIQAAAKAEREVDTTKDFKSRPRKTKQQKLAEQLAALRKEGVDINQVFVDAENMAAA